MSRHKLGRLRLRAWDLEMSADVGQQLTVPSETVSRSLRPEKALRSHTQQSLDFGDFKMLCIFFFSFVISLDCSLSETG